jgi:hypothetical protein
MKTKSTKPPKGYKRLQCKYCENISDRVNATADAITCWQCTLKLVNGHVLELRK